MQTTHFSFLLNEENVLNTFKLFEEGRQLNTMDMHNFFFLYISYKTRGYVTHFSPNKRYRSHKQPTAVTLLRPILVTTIPVTEATVYK